MFESPLQRALSRFDSHQATEWDYADELATMADWLCHGSEPSQALSRATRALDTFRGPITVKRWLHAVTTFEVHAGGGRCSHDLYLDSLVEGSPARGPGNRNGLDIEIHDRMVILEGIAGMRDNYRCALLLKEGHGLTVAQTSSLLGSSSASVRSILYRARQLIRS